MRTSQHSRPGFWALRAESRADAIEILGADHVAMIEASDSPAATLRRLRRGAWDANLLPELSAYEVLVKEVG